MAVDSSMYTIKDVSKQLKVPTGNLKTWEGTFSNVLQVRRTKTGSRIYHDLELNTLKKIKLMKDKNMSDDLINFILNTDHVDRAEVPQQVAAEYDLKYEDIIALQTETVQAVQDISNSFEHLKDEFIKGAKESNEELKTIVKQELLKGNAITEGMVQTYSQEVLTTYSRTYKQLKKLKESIEREKEENLFLQKKIEEREELFQEFVQNYRQSAAALEEKREKRKVSSLFYSLFGIKKFI